MLGDFGTKAANAFTTIDIGRLRFEVGPAFSPVEFDRSCLLVISLSMSVAFLFLRFLRSFGRNDGVSYVEIQSNVSLVLLSCVSQCLTDIYKDETYVRCFDLHCRYPRVVVGGWPKVKGLRGGLPRPGSSRRGSCMHLLVAGNPLEYPADKTFGF
jgi:hypothetical protein